MREIKFRAWCEGTHNNMTFSEPHMEYNAPVVDGAYASFEMSDLMGVYNTVPLMQYTGLKDKNGKEIYFGDILQTSSDDPDTDMWGPTEWGYTVCEEATDILGVRFTNWWPTDEDDNVFNWKYVEIIGNIYEHSDLLPNQ